MVRGCAIGAKDMGPDQSFSSSHLSSTHTGAELCRHFNQVELSRRWKISPRTLERWRWLRQGPAFLRIGGRVVYRLADIEEYERTNLRAVQAGKGAGR